MSDFNKLPISPLTSFGPLSVQLGKPFGTNFSVYGVGGFMEVYSLDGLLYTIPSGFTGNIEYTGNTIPIQLTKGSGSIFSPDVLTLNSDNISSGRRRLGMLVYVYNQNQIYQYNIDNYTTLWNNATGATGVGGPTVVVSNFGTTIKSNSPAGIAFISAWTANTIEGVNGETSTTAVWKKLVTGGGGGGQGSGISAFTYSSNTLTILDVTGGTYSVTINNFTGLTINGGLSANTISATTYYGDGSNLTGIPKGGGGGGQLYYFNISNTQSPYYEFSTSATSVVEQSITVSTGSSQTAYIGGFMTPSNLPNVTSLPPGIISFYIHANTNNSNATFDLYCELYKRDISDVETLLFTSDVVIVLGTVTNMYITDGFFSGTTLNTTDRLVVKVYATNTSNQTRSITMLSEGTLHYSFSYTTIPTFSDSYVTGFTYSNNTLTILQNNNKGNFSQTINTLTGLTINGNLSVTGNTVLNSLTATTISATTYNNLPVSGLTSGNNIGITNNNNNFTISFTGGTVTASTIYNNGLTANTLNVTGVTILDGTTASTLNVTGDTILNGLTANTLNVTGNTIFTSGITATTISAETYLNTPYIISGSNGSSSFMIKDGSNTLSGFYSYILGQNSTITNSNYSLLSGNQNLISSSESSFIFGGLNTIQSNSEYSFIQGYFNTINNNSNNSVIFGTSIELTGIYSFVQGYNSYLSGDYSAIFGQGISGYSDNNVYLPWLNLNYTPTNDNTLTKLLVRDTTDGTVKTRDLSTYYSITGITAQTLTMVDNSNNPVFQVIANTGISLVQINDLSGLPAFEVFTNGSIKFGAQPNVLTNYQSLYTTTGVTADTGTTIIYSLPTTAYTGAFFDYTLLSGTSNLRAGSVVSVWNSGGTSIEYTETSTNDIGTTTAVTFNMSATSTNVYFQASAVTSGWTIKSMVRTI